MGISVGDPITGSCLNNAFLYNSSNTIQCGYIVGPEHLANGTNANSSTFFRGDGVWATPLGMGISVTTFGATCDGSTDDLPLTC
jgi:hypothetical protein